MKKWHLYVLIKDNNPVYVGLSTDIETRIKKHRTNKHFDKYLVLESFDDKKQALAAERCIIKFYTLFRKHDWLNGENGYLSMVKYYIFDNVRVDKTT
jgi:predicted GIY-YIG superfamily endonuclease